MWLRVLTLCVAMGGVTTALVWLKNESPHPKAADASRESPWIVARSLQPRMETTVSSPLAAYAMKSAGPAAVVPSAPAAIEVLAPPSRPLPVWLLADAPEFANDPAQAFSPGQTTEQLRRGLRDRGARQMGEGVRFAMLNVGELLAMNHANWEASMATPAASENRASALLLTFYLQRLDRGGDGAGVRDLVQAMEQGMTEAQAVRDFILAGRSVAGLEREMSLAFANAGVELQFTRRGGAVFKP